MATRLYSEGPWTFRALQRYRPYICPFEELLVDVPRNSSVLDIGCGGGLFLGLVGAAGLKPRGVGFDVSSPAISLAKHMAPQGSSLGGNLEFRQINATEPWPEGEFDVVAMVDVIHHVPRSQQENVIRRACRKVRPAGRFLYKDMVAKPRWRAIANRLHDLVLARQWIHYLSVGDVERWAQEEGLSLQRSLETSRLWYGHELRVFCRPAS